MEIILALIFLAFTTFVIFLTFKKPEWKPYTIGITFGLLLSVAFLVLSWNLDIFRNFLIPSIILTAISPSIFFTALSWITKKISFKKKQKVLRLPETNTQEYINSKERNFNTNIIVSLVSLFVLINLGFIAYYSYWSYKVAYFLREDILRFQRNQYAENTRVYETEKALSEISTQEALSTEVFRETEKSVAQSTQTQQALIDLYKLIPISEDIPSISGDVEGIRIYTKYSPLDEPSYHNSIEIGPIIGLEYEISYSSSSTNRSFDQYYVLYFPDGQVKVSDVSQTQIERYWTGSYHRITIKDILDNFEPGIYYLDLFFDGIKIGSTYFQVY